MWIPLTRWAEAPLLPGLSSASSASGKVFDIPGRTGEGRCDVIAAMTRSTPKMLPMMMSGFLLRVGAAAGTGDTTGGAALSPPAGGGPDGEEAGGRAGAGGIGPGAADGGGFGAAGAGAAGGPPAGWAGGE